MDFLDEETRPRFLFQGRSSAAIIASRDLDKLHIAGCFSVSGLLLGLALYFSGAQIGSSLLLWFALSLLLAPFAPSSLTGGDIRVGHGAPLPSFSDADADEPKKRPSARRTRPPETLPSRDPSFIDENGCLKDPSFISDNGCLKDPAFINEEKPVIAQEKEWTEDDLDLLKRQIVKHPVGAPRRWEKVAEAFQGRHGLESVISTAKSLGERRGGDSFQQFLKQRKPIDKRIDGDEVKQGDGIWSSESDIALLNALKTFPKDVPMRWEKIAAAVPGKSKDACIKRTSKLKKDFRTSKASEA